ncbi:hypothetical protein FACS1894139_11330 [Planctomycetales bacterium]|nr:hypothetical protein FACS1894108_06450 [Planctomycetales bacterium]GHT06148.1 hypothetical protein FACS1894139_11330 [Planctomycetales bacterium]GHV20783.1 hypothetical protein AGMMS49959_08820 [Planctomycetales bacterium]
MENLNAISHLFVESRHPCQKEGCEADCIIIDTISGSRFCRDHAPRLWIEDAYRNNRRLAEEARLTPSACVMW